MTDRHTALRLTIIVLMLHSIVIGCGGGGKLQRRPGEELRGGKIDPFQYGDEFAVNDKIASRADTMSVSLPSSMPETSSPASSEAATSPVRQPRRQFDASAEPVYGYRVQIGIDQDKSKMENLAEKARSATELNIYLEFEAPFYRVRVGDFKTRQEAEKYVRTMKNNGFSDALWVMSQIAVQ